MALQTDLNHTHLKVNHHLKKIYNNDTTTRNMAFIGYSSERTLLKRGGEVGHCPQLAPSPLCLTESLLEHY